MSRRSRINRAQSLAIVYGMMCFILVLVVCQVWLITATVNAYLGGDDSVAGPAAVASFVCLGLNLGLLYFLVRMPRP